MPTPLEIYAEAYEMQSQGNIVLAETKYREIIRSHPDSPESRYAAIQVEELENIRKKSETKPVPGAEEKKPVTLPEPKPQPVAVQPAAPPVIPKPAPHPVPPKAVEPPAAEQPDIGAKRASSSLGILGFAFSLALLVAVFILFFMVRSTNRELAYQKSLIKAYAALNADDDRAFLRHIFEAKSLNPTADDPGFLMVDYHLKRKDLASAKNELRNCSTLNNEFKEYIEKIKNLQKAGTGLPAAR